jgi:dipeptidyl aminopeptidase/acylaminoacyl peptidase
MSPSRLPPLPRHVHVFIAVALSFAPAVASAAAELPRLQIEDLYRSDLVTSAITLADGRSAIYCRQRVDTPSRTIRQSLWRVDDQGPPRPLESGEPDAFSPQLSPDGKWIVFLSTRAFADGTPAFQPVPPFSDPAADIWLIPVAGGKAIPLGGKAKPYGRVITDSFYGRVAFSADGRRLVFVADTGGDPRTEAERRNNVIVVREDQGEGYEGYGPMQIWVADLPESPGETAASRITRITHDDFWYGDPQWAPDGTFIVVHANRTPDQESARYSINRNYDLWKIRLADHGIEPLTTGPGPEFSPRISPDGRRILCLSSPRRGPHRDVFNLMLVELTPSGPRTRVVFDHHGSATETPPHLWPEVPLPAECWRDDHRVVFNVARGLRTELQCVDLDRGPETVPYQAPAAKRSPLLPASISETSQRLRAPDEVVRWKSKDGLEIEGVVTLPPPSIAQPPFKLILLPHGGPHHRASGGGAFQTQYFATHGYAVFQPNFRGSTGYGLKFLDANREDLGGADMQDMLAGIDHLIERGIVDRNRQFIYGVSYGGFTATWLVGQTHQFRAAVAQNPVTDMNVMWHLSDLQSWTEWDLGGLPWEIPERMRERSPLTYAPQVRTPMLLLSSLNDRRCPIAMAKMYYRALKKNGVETEMVIYPDENHGIRQLAHREDVTRRVLDWFERHDLPATRAAPADRATAPSGDRRE